MRVMDRCDTAVGLFIARDPMAGVLTPAPPAIELQAGVDIAGMIAHAVNQGFLDEADLPDLRVYVDGRALPFSTYEEQAVSLDFTPEPGQVVNLQVEPLGGSNGLARTVLQVVLVAVAIVSAFTVGPATASVWMAASGIVPQVIFPIKRPDSLAGPNDQGALAGSANQIRRRGPMPLMLGKGRVAFDVAGNAYTSIVNGDTWLHVIFGVHLGPCSVDDIKIGETLLSDYPAADIQIESFLTPGPRDFSFYAQSVHPEPLQDELDLGGPAEVHTTAEVCDRVEIDLTWPSGLSFRKDNGSIVQQETRVQVRWAPVGTEDWQAAPLEGGPYRDRLGATLPVGTVDVMARTQDPVRRTFGWDKANSDQIKIEVRAWDPDNDDATKATQATYWTGLRSIVKKKPIVDEDLSCIALRIKSSDDLGGTLPTVTGVVTPHAPVYDAETGTWNDAYEDWAASDNGAALVRMLLLGPAAARPHDPEEWGESFGVVHELIEARGWKGCYRLEGQASQEDALKILGQIGHFSGYDAGEGLVLVPDWEKPVARQLFTGLNAEDYSYTRNFPDPLHAVIVEFRNVDESGDDDEVVVYQPGYGPVADPAADPPVLEATEIETIRLEYQCTGERATREGRTYLAKRNISVEVHEWTAGPSAIASSYGARVLLRHASALYGQAEARVQYRHMAGGLVAGVRLSDVVEMVEGEVYAVDVQRVDRILPGVIVETRPGRTKDLWFPSPLEVDDAPEKDDLLAFGRAEVVTEDLEIADFAPADDGVRIIARKYIGPALVAAETGEIPAFETKLTPRPRAPTPRLLGQPQATPDGVKIAFEIDEVRGSLVEGFPIRWRRSSTGSDENPWVNAPAAGPTARVAMTPPLLDAVSAGRDPQAEYRVDVEVRCKIRIGDVSAPLRCEDILITRDVLEPVGFTAVGATRTAESGASYPVLSVRADAIVSGLVQDLIVEVRPHGADEDAYVSAGQPLPATNPVGDFAPMVGGAVLDVRAAFRTADNWTSQWVTVSNVTIPAGALVADDTKSVGKMTSEQVNQQLVDLTPVREAAEDIVNFTKVTGPLVADLKDAVSTARDEARQNAFTTIKATIAAAQADEQQREDSYVAGEKPRVHALRQEQRTDSAISTLEALTVTVDDNMATVADFMSAQVTINEAVAIDYEGLSAQIGENKATYDSFVQVQADTNKATTEALTKQSSQVSDVSSSLESFKTTQADTNKALAASTSTLTTNFNDFKGTVEANYASKSYVDGTVNAYDLTLKSWNNSNANPVAVSAGFAASTAATVAGQLYGSAGLKVNAGGAIAGVTAYAESGASDKSVVLIQADKLLLQAGEVTNPTGLAPFVWDAGTGTFYCENITLRRGNIQGAAISTAMGFESIGTVVLSTFPTMVGIGQAVNAGSGADIFVSPFLYAENSNPSSGQDVTVKVYKDGLLWRQRIFHINPANQGHISWTSLDKGVTGSHTYSIYAETTPGGGSDCRATAASLVVNALFNTGPGT